MLYSLLQSKVNDKAVKDKLASVTEAEIKDKTKALELAREILLGKESTIVGRLNGGANNLGRSLITDLNTKGFALVDHRTLKSIIINNVRYYVAK